MLQTFQQNMMLNSTILVKISLQDPRHPGRFWKKLLWQCIWPWSKCTLSTASRLTTGKPVGACRLARARWGARWLSWPLPGLFVASESCLSTSFFVPNTVFIWCCSCLERNFTLFRLCFSFTVVNVLNECSVASESCLSTSFFVPNTVFIWCCSCLERNSMKVGRVLKKLVISRQNLSRSSERCKRI